MTGLVQDEKRYQYLTRVTKQKAYMNGKAQIEIKFHDEWNINVVFARSEFDCVDERWWIMDPKHENTLMKRSNMSHENNS